MPGARSSPILEEQLIRAVVRAAVAMARETVGMPEQMQHMVDAFLADPVPAESLPRLAEQASSLGACSSRPSVVGFDARGEGMGHVPWYAG
jgi:hypothetical protein